MRNISIITLTGNSNYGNRLQNYALAVKVSKYNYNVESIWIDKGKIYRKIKNIIIILLSNFIKRYARRKNFICFTDKYIRTNYVSDINKIKNEYSYFITGSDQVWNYKFNGSNYLYFLRFSEYNKNISYSASFGVSTIPEELRNEFKDGLNNIRYISVREDRGKEIINELTGRNDIEVLIDPTMLLKGEEWDKVSIKPKMLKNDKFILNYFLGNLSESRKKAIEEIAQENNCEIINLFDKDSPYYVCGPSEFLYLEKNAFLICTDSFHSSVFAILYDRPFVVFDREEEGMNDMGSRLDTLLNKFELKNRKYNGKNITKENLNHDYTEAYRILEKERKKSDKFLRKALDIKEGE